MSVKSRLLSWRSRVFLSASYTAFPAKLDTSTADCEITRILGLALSETGASMFATVRIGLDGPDFLRSRPVWLDSWL